MVDDVALFQVYKPLLECEDLRDEFQFLVLNISTWSFENRVA